MVRSDSVLYFCAQKSKQKWLTTIRDNLQRGKNVKESNIQQFEKYQKYEETEKSKEMSYLN